MSASRNWHMLALLMVLLVFAGLMAGCQAATEAPVVEEPPAEEPMADQPTDLHMAAILTVGLDNAWDKTFIESYEAVQADPPYGLTVHDIDYTEGVWGDEAELVLREYAETGKYDIIWAHSTYSDQVKNLKDEYPDIAWVVVGSGNEGLGGNVYWVYKRIHEPSYMMGILAGCMTQTDVVGAVGTYAFDDVNDEINAFFAGAKSVNPDIQQKVSFIESWYDPAKALEAFNAQLAAGVDHNFMIAEAFEPCSDADIYCYGPYMDYSQIYDGVLSSAMASWEPDIRWVIDGWWDHVANGEPYDAPAEKHWFSMREGAASMAPFHEMESDIPQECLDMVDQAQADFMAGDLEVELNVEPPVSD